MPFFSRPILSNEQFKQLTDSELILSGSTRIATLSGLTLTDGAGGYRPIIAAGGNNFDVLTLINNEIVLSPSAAASGGEIYTCASPSTCTVGGLSSGTTIYGMPLIDIFEDILVPTLNPGLTAPSSTYAITPTTTIYEVGSVISITGYATFSRGYISPQYCGGPQYRSGLPACYNYVDFGSPTSVGSTNLNNTHIITPYTISVGNNTVSASVCYSVGSQPLNSSGNPYLTPLPAGSTTAVVKTITGIYPYFYGKVASGGCPAGVNRPTPTCAMIIAGTKCVAVADGTICINFNSTSDDYLFFAVPVASTPKTKWYVDTANNGNIGGVVSSGGNLFPAYNSVGSVTTTCWAGQTYQVYISNYQTETNTIMELRNT